MPPVSVYIHTPFCVVKCGYCDFHSTVPDGNGPLDLYLDALARELELVTLPAEPHTVFVGGGTPSYFDAPRFARLLALLEQRLRWRASREVTLEANPESVTLEKLQLARAHGVTRLSIGAQTFAAERLRFLDRAHDAAAIGWAVEQARAAGFANVSLDLIFGLPGQTLDEWQQDVEQALALQPDHLSCYNLTFEPGTRLEHARQQGRVAPNEEAADAAMFRWTRGRLTAAGFVAYEISNFAGRGGPCLHNDHYWLQGDYVGVGPSASSHRSGRRWTNLKPLEPWAAALRAGTPPIASAETLTRAQRAGEAVWLGLRRRDGVDFAAVSARLQLPLRERFAAVVDRLLAAQLVAWQGEQLQLTERGLLHADHAGAAFLGLDAHAVLA